MKKRTAAAALALITTFCHFSVKADNYAYMGEYGGDFGSIDLTSGAFTLLGDPGVTITGMAVEGGTLYGGSFDAGFLYSINPANGALTTIGNSAVPYEVFGSTTSGMFAVGRDENLYSVSPTTGAATLIGPTGISQVGVVGLSTEASALYYAVGGNIYTLNTTTGAPTLLANTGGPEMGALVMEDGILYGGSDFPTTQVYAVNPITAALTSGPVVTGTSGNFWSLAPESAPDEASTISLLLGVVGIGRFLFRRRLQTN
jgi:hypothetical protein